MKLSTLFDAYELVCTDREMVQEERRNFFPPKNIGSAKDQMARLWQRRNRQRNTLSEGIEERIYALENGEDGIMDQPAMPRIVCLCGSTRFWREFQKASLRETMQGRIVLSIGAASGTDDDHFGNLPREARLTPTRPSTRATRRRWNTERRWKRSAVSGRYIVALCARGADSAGGISESKPGQPH